MRLISLIPFGLGIIAVLQATFNRQAAKSIGLLGATFVNGLILVLTCLAAAMIFRLYLGSSDIQFGGLGSLRWWHYLTGIFGFLLVTGIPYAIQSVGALSVFIGIVAAQMATSLLWDWWFEGIELSALRITGAALAVIGALLANWKFE